MSTNTQATADEAEAIAYLESLLGKTLHITIPDGQYLDNFEVNF